MSFAKGIASDVMYTELGVASKNGSLVTDGVLLFNISSLLPWLVDQSASSPWRALNGEACGRFVDSLSAVAWENSYARADGTLETWDIRQAVETVAHTLKRLCSAMGAALPSPLPSPSSASTTATTTTTTTATTTHVAPPPTSGATTPHEPTTVVTTTSTAGPTTTTTTSAAPPPSAPRFVATFAADRVPTAMTLSVALHQFFATTHDDAVGDFNVTIIGTNASSSQMTLKGRLSAVASAASPVAVTFELTNPNSGLPAMAAANALIKATTINNTAVCAAVGAVSVDAVLSPPSVTTVAPSSPSPPSGPTTTAQQRPHRG